ncbi:MAG TPA: hypothetical protein VFU15_03900 [Bacteroidia bacterium]|nr:hypothetical protein [Bacteroidia bacterium]
MNEWNDNLPADFEDLSKHAPLLDKLRAKGDGFAVPENYFSEALSVIESLVRLPGKNGMTVPENYFTDLAQHIISSAELAKLKDENPLSVPENYFEALADDITSHAALKSISENEFVIPENYFTGFDDTLNTKIALDNIRQDDGFSTPEGYFEKLSSSVMARVAMDDLSKGSDADVPEGYFDTLAGRIAEKIAAEENGPEKNRRRGRVIVFAEVLRRYAKPAAIAASAALLILAGTWFVNHSAGGELKNNSVASHTHAPVSPLPAPPSPVIQPGPAQQDVAVNKPRKKKNHSRVNHEQGQVVKVEKQDVMQSLDQLDENIVADFVADQKPDVNKPADPPAMNDAMYNYLLNNNADLGDLIKDSNK